MKASYFQRYYEATVHRPMYKKLFYDTRAVYGIIIYYKKSFTYHFVFKQSLCLRYIKSALFLVWEADDTIIMAIYLFH